MDWPHDLDHLQNFAERLLKLWREDNPHTPRQYPTAEWLRENGFSQLRWVLRKKHDMTTESFFIMLTSAGDDAQYEWDINNVATINRARAYLDDQAECRNWARETERAHRARINETLRRVARELGSDEFLRLANDPSARPEFYRAFKTVIKNLRQDFTSDDSVQNYLRATYRFFRWLDRNKYLECNPIEDIECEFRWDTSSDSDELTDEQVRSLWLAADTDEERMLVIGYCVWGLRTQELPAVHIEQFRTDRCPPVVVFDEGDRKNGAGEVTLLFGWDAVTRLVISRSHRSDWNGYLYPSENEGCQTLSARQVRRRFKTLSQKAGVTIDGNPATPKHGRAHYYNILTRAETDLMECLAKIAETQGSTDAISLRDHYLSTEEHQRYRRFYFRRHIQNILPEDAYVRQNVYRYRKLDEFK